jgi:hypothetical protein
MSGKLLQWGADHGKQLPILQNMAKNSRTNASMFEDNAQRGYAAIPDRAGSYDAESTGQPKNGGRVKAQMMEKAKPTCFKPGDQLKSGWAKEASSLPENQRQSFINGKLSEYYKQVKDQEAGLNNLTVEQFLNNKNKFEKWGRSQTEEEFDKFKRAGTDSVQQELHAKQFSKVYRNIANSLQNSEKYDELSAKEIDKLATEKARSALQGLAALHNPDLAGGGFNVVTRLGDSKINSSIGSQWLKSLDKDGETRVSQIAKNAQAAMEKLGPNAKMNVELSVCKE